MLAVGGFAGKEGGFLNSVEERGGGGEWVATFFNLLAPRCARAVNVFFMNVSYLLSGVASGQWWPKLNFLCAIDSKYKRKYFCFTFSVVASFFSRYLIT